MTNKEKGEEIKSLSWCPFSESTCYYNIKGKGVFAKDLRTNESIKANFDKEVELLVENTQSQNIVAFATEDYHVGFYDFRANKVMI